MNENEVATVVVDSAISAPSQRHLSVIEVHRTLGGAGLLEAVYEEALVFELGARGLAVERQRAVPLFYKGQRLASDLRLDLRVQELVVVECNATVTENRLFEAQALTYLRVTDRKLALVIKFGEQYVRQGIHRVVNALER